MNACVGWGLRTGESTGRSLRSLTLTTIHYYRESTGVQVSNRYVVKPENMRQFQEPHLHGRRQADEDEAGGTQHDCGVRVNSGRKVLNVLACASHAPVESRCHVECV